MSGIFNPDIFNNAIFNVGDTAVTRSTGGGPPKVMWGEWSTPFTPEQPSGVRETLSLLVGKDLGESVSAEVTRQAVEREVAAREQEQAASTLKAKRRAAQERRAARQERERIMGTAFNAAFEAAFSRYMERDLTYRRQRDDDEEAVAIILMMH